MAVNRPSLRAQPKDKGGLHSIIDSYHNRSKNPASLNCLTHFTQNSFHIFSKGRHMYIQNAYARIWRSERELRGTFSLEPRM